MQQSPLVISNVVLGDSFGWNMVFPYNVNGWELTMTLKKSLSQSDGQADARVQMTPVGLVADANGNYTTTLALTPAQTATLLPIAYYFDITSKDLSANVEHIVSPESVVTFIPSVTLTP